MSNSDKCIIFGTSRFASDCNVCRLVRTKYFISRKVLGLRRDIFLILINCYGFYRRHLALQSLDQYDDDDSLRKFYRNSKYEVSAAEWAICGESQEYCAIAVSCVTEEMRVIMILYY